MTTIGYIRVSTEKQDLDKQRHLLLEYAHQHKITIDEFIEVEISSRKSQRERRITDLIEKLDRGDQLLVAELSRLGRNMLETLNLINTLNEMAVQIVLYVNQSYQRRLRILNYCWRYIAISHRLSASSFR
ncbi:MAG: recombinase family protein [Chloroflexota bacterium]